MSATKAEIMEGVECTTSKIIDNNTIEYTRPDGVKMIRFHGTDIMTFPKKGGVILNSGGWKTVTTKERMNSYNGECTIIQDKGMWYVSTSSNSYQGKDSRIPYFDGIKIKNRTVINPKKSAHRKEQVLLRQIKAYCTAVKKLDVLPMPNGGDCWYCSMQTEDGKSWGDAAQSHDHLLEHLKEKYIMGSLIFNALKHVGYTDPSIILHMDIRDSIVSAVRKYFKAKLGLAS